MPKMKTKSGAKKRFRVTASGKVKGKAAFARHMMMNKPKSMKRKAKGGMVLSEVNATKVIDNWMPYDRKKKKRAARKATRKAQGGAE